MKPQVKSLLEAEFTRVGYDPNAKKSATRSVIGDESAAGGGKGSGNAIPRQDITTLLDKNIVTELNLTEGKNSWQNRKTAIEAVSAACERAGFYLECNKATLEVLKALKARVSDTQANLKPLATTAIAQIITSFEKECTIRTFKSLGSSMLLGLADNKKAMRDSTIASLQVCTGCRSL